MTEVSPKSAKDILDLYFIENRARVLDIASFLDRLDRYRDSAAAKADFRYQALLNALKLLLAEDRERTRNIQLSLSDRSTEPIESAVGLKAVGAWEGSFHEHH